MSENPERMTRAIRWLQAYAALMTIALVVLFFRSGTETDGVLRARGLVIEDDAGRERILIGAPIPEAAGPGSRAASCVCAFRFPRRTRLPIGMLARSEAGDRATPVQALHKRLHPPLFTNGREAGRREAASALDSEC